MRDCASRVIAAYVRRQADDNKSVIGRRVTSRPAVCTTCTARACAQATPGKAARAMHVHIQRVSFVAQSTGERERKHARSATEGKEDAIRFLFLRKEVRGERFVGREQTYSTSFFHLTK